MGQTGEIGEYRGCAGSEDYAEGHIPGAVNLPKAQWHDAKIVKTRLNKKKINVLYCYSQVCHPAATAAVEFAKRGYPAMELRPSPQNRCKFGSNGFRATHAPLLCRNWGIAVA